MSSHDLLMVFSKFCKNVGIRNPYSNARQLGVRLLNDETALKEGNWVIVRKEGSVSPYWRIIHGERLMRFRKVLKEVLVQ